MCTYQIYTCAPFALTARKKELKEKLEKIKSLKQTKEMKEKEEDDDDDKRVAIIDTGMFNVKVRMCAVCC